MTADSVLIASIRFLLIQQSKLIGFAHHCATVFLILKVKRVQLNTPFLGHNEESFGLVLTTVMEPTKGSNYYFNNPLL